MARDVGVQLVNMEQIQLLHATNPVTGLVGDTPSVAAATEGMVFVNKNGRRFVREDGRRDDMAKAIIAQPDSMTYIIFSADGAPDPNTAKTLDGRTISYMLENKLSDFVTADTLDELAGIIGVPGDALKKSLDDFNTHVDSQTPDEFGRVLFTYKLAKGPWYAFPRKPAAHHTMGGVLIDEDTHALREDGSKIPGLYCAGEITGVIHGGNRLGGNAIVDFTVFGKIAGANAAAGK
jgi:succinate dehydrogenase/fumarate reductase flavoprotein subunit